MLFALHVCVHIKVTSSQNSEPRATPSADEISERDMATVGEMQLHNESQEAYVRSKLCAKLQDLAPVREAVVCLPSPVDDRTCILLHDALKILFNQTLGWVGEECQEVSLN